MSTPSRRFEIPETQQSRRAQESPAVKPVFWDEERLELSRCGVKTGVSIGAIHSPSAKRGAIRQATQKRDNLMRATLHAAAIAVMLVSSTPAFAALKPGAKAPPVATQAALGGKQFQFNLADALKKGPVVLYFYPKAYTKGCTLEANQFAEATADFNQLGATVVGMSADTIETLKKFSVEECRSKFAIAAASPATIKAYDVKLAITGLSDRTSYVIAPNGTIAYAYSSLDYREHVKNSLAAVKAWKAAKR
jgi:thioredoxin-dependent peroxiredoxin